jgi:hypothetical protein
LSRTRQRVGEGHFVALPLLSPASSRRDNRWQKILGQMLPDEAQTSTFGAPVAMGAGPPSE